MRIVVAGGTGFLGSALTQALAADGHEVVVLTRTPTPPPAPAHHIHLLHWQPNGQSGPWASVLDGAGAIVNLAGESIAARRWSSARKILIRNSRVQATRSLVSAVHAARSSPPVFISASAVGYYGPHGDEILTEEARPGGDFLATVCEDWEREAARAADRARVVLIRTGIVLARDGGALSKMLPPFRMFVGGPLGSGRQYMSWIHRDDWVEIVRWALLTSSVSGPLNATAPNPVTNAEFSSALGSALRRPSWLPAPGFALRLVLGEMADALLLSGQRILPAKANALGFRFAFANADLDEDPSQFRGHFLRR